ncbi:LCP family protein [Patescibacteria group bacterium]|nr:LCP family protein [Patescibacteria group bacterium]
MKDFIKENKILVIIFISLFIIEIIAGSFYLYLIRKRKEKTNQIISQEESIVTDSEPKTDKNINVLLLGMGGEGHSGGTLSDSIALVNINPEEKKVNIISIPRDLWVAIPTDWNNETYNKINASYAIGVDDSVRYPNKKPEFKGKLGGGILSKYVIEKVTGIPIDYFVAIDFSNYIDVINILGGIEVNVEKPLDDYFYPVKGLENETCGFSAEKIAEVHQKYSGFELEKQFTCRYEYLHFERGKQNMDGETALKFVRSRHSSQYGGDFARSERQHEVLDSIREKILSKNILGKGNEVLAKLNSSVTTDIDINLLKEVLEPLGNITQYQVNHIYITEENLLNSGKSSNGQYILQPKAGQGNFEGIKSYIQKNSK